MPVASALIATRATPNQKAAFAALAKSRGITESGLLTFLVETALEQNPAAAAHPRGVASVLGEAQSSRVAHTSADQDVDQDDDVSDPGSSRISLRLRHGDRELADVRATARRMKTATYLVALIRAHVRGHAPVPTAELNELKVAVGELSAIGRNLNQLARYANASELSRNGPSLQPSLPADMGQLLQLTRSEVAALRQIIADYVRTNLQSWESEDA